MTDALIGHTGFVGGHLSRQHRFDHLFNSRNIEEIAGGDYDLLVCSAMPAAKWIANREPEADARALDRLRSGLAATSARHVVVISTVDVYPCPVDVDEESPIDAGSLQPYGRHRLLLELFVRERFPSVTIVRLPALFGVGLRKNAIYDLVHDNETDKINGDSVYQFYNLTSLWADIDTARASGLGVVNFATEPLRIGDIARTVFGRELSSWPPAARYDFRSRFAARFGGENGYLYSAVRVLSELEEFVSKERGA